MYLGLGVGSFNSTLRFDGDREVDVEMSTLSVSGAWLINDIWTVRAGLGVILDGELKPDIGNTHDLEPGWLASVGLEYRALIGKGKIPFIDLSVFLSGSWTKAVESITDNKTSYSASDLRLGARAGWNVKGNTFPYVAVRLFGGPVDWELSGADVIGTDTNHYQIALGTAVQLGSVSVYFEWAALGEQALGLGLSMAW